MIGSDPSSPLFCQQSCLASRARTASTRLVIEVVCGAASAIPSRIAPRSRIETRSLSSACSTRWMVVALTTVGTRSSTSFFCSPGRSLSSFCTSP